MRFEDVIFDAFCPAATIRQLSASWFRESPYVFLSRFGELGVLDGKAGACGCGRCSQGTNSLWAPVRRFAALSEARRVTSTQRVGSRLINGAIGR